MNQLKISEDDKKILFELIKELESDNQENIDSACDAIKEIVSSFHSEYVRPQIFKLEDLPY